MTAILPQLPPVGPVGSRTDSEQQDQHLMRDVSHNVSPTEAEYQNVQSWSQETKDDKERSRPRKQHYELNPRTVQPVLLPNGNLSKNEDMCGLSDEMLNRDNIAEDARFLESLPEDDDADKDEEKDVVLKLSPAKLCELTSSPNWLPVRNSVEDLKINTVGASSKGRGRWTISDGGSEKSPAVERAKDRRQSTSSSVVAPLASNASDSPIASFRSKLNDPENTGRPQPTPRTISTPLLKRRLSSSKASTSSKANQTPSARTPKVTPLPLRLDNDKASNQAMPIEDPEPSPMPPSIPLPPISLPTYLQLELSSQRPSPLYIHRSITSDFPYESSRVKIDRLLNFLFLPPQLEKILVFGALACLDCWLYSFTILPLRFFKALSVLAEFWVRCITQEARFISAFIYNGIGRMWRRAKHRETLNGNATSNGPAPGKDIAGKLLTGRPATDQPEPDIATQAMRSKTPQKFTSKHRRTKSEPSALSADHKADILKGFLILVSCIILMYFDASRMYHGIRGQAAIKLYVIYNVLEVCDKLFSALGQDVLECLLSKEALERKPDGRSKVWRPFWLFILALCYNVIHSTALFYQVITLNVAVNSYSNALLTLLMSNQFVEIKSTVFKKFEKENLFQLTCADVVERFQLCLMLLIIASRNIIETGGLSVQGSSSAPDQQGSILPKSFMLFPEWTGQVMGAFFLVLGSEMLVDWIKHAYITKFNNTKPAIYDRFLDVLAKDYYSNAFADQNLTRRLGLPVIPLACLFIRASVQTYHMFLATHMPLPLPSTATSISLESATASPATTAALQHIDQIFRRALGRSTFGNGDPSLAPNDMSIWSLDDIIAFGTMALFFLTVFLVLLAFKLILGMVLLSWARSRYKGMKSREFTSVHAEGRRVGGWGVVEVDEDKRRWIYADDPAGARRLREKEREISEREKRVAKEGGESFAGVSRYSMISKRIW
ncbi:hypothetical protein ACLMJK_007919 [Lecanora helva]